MTTDAGDDDANAQPDTPPRRAPASGRARRFLGSAWGAAVVVFAVALTVRLWVLHDLRAGDPMLVVALLDDAVYLDLARTGSGRLADFMAPLHPFLLRALSVAVPVSMAAASGLNAVLGSIAAVVAGAAARDLVDARAGWIAGLATALLGAFVFHDVLPGQESAITLATVTILWCAVRLAARANLATAASLGAAAGVAALGRGTAILSVLAILPALRGRVPRERARLLGAAAVGTCAVLATFAGIQSLTGDGFAALPWSTGPNLYLANGPESRESCDFVSSELGAGPGRIAQRAEDVARAALGSGATESEVSRWWVARTWRERGSVGELAGHVGSKGLLFLGRHEQSGNHSVEVERAYSPYLGAIPVGAWWILAAGIAAWWLVRPRLPAADSAAWIVASQWAALALFFPLARYRLPSAAVCVVLVAAAIRVAPAVDWRRPRAWSAAIALAAAVAVAFLPIRGARDSNAVARVNIAVAHRLLGSPAQKVLDELRIALRDDPSSPFANEMLGRVLVESGQPGLARPHLDIAARSGVPSRVRGANAVLVRVLADSGDLAGAEDLLQRTHDPVRPDAELLAHGAVVAFRSGAPDEATRRLAIAWAANPEDLAVGWATRQCGLSEQRLRETCARLGIKLGEGVN